jgi:hypothetical protein
MPTRTIIQLAATQVAESSLTQCEMYLHALCDDGTVWRINNRDISENGFWEAVPPIPQPEPEVVKPQGDRWFLDRDEGDLWGVPPNSLPCVKVESAAHAAHLIKLGMTLVCTSYGEHSARSIAARFAKEGEPSLIERRPGDGDATFTYLFDPIPF